MHVTSECPARSVPLASGKGRMATRGLATSSSGLQRDSVRTLAPFGFIAREAVETSYEIC
jgi:hypothetical protein